MKTRKLAIDAMLAAMCAVLGYLALDTGNVKVTFESLPVMLGALLFGPVDGMLVGGVGTLIYQLLRYGVSLTTLLWIAPYVVCGLLVGQYSKKHGYDLTKKQIALTVILNQLLIFVLNTGVIYIDSKLYGYYSAAYVFGAIAIRSVICVITGVAFALVLPPIIKATRGIIRS